MGFGGQGGNGHVCDWREKGKGSAPTSVQVLHLSQMEMLFRVESDHLNEAPLHVGNSFWGECGPEAGS